MQAQQGFSGVFALRALWFAAVSRGVRTGGWVSFSFEHPRVPQRCVAGAPPRARPAGMALWSGVHGLAFAHYGRPRQGNRSASYLLSRYFLNFA
mgnify:CR=1 FL=1